MMPVAYGHSDEPSTVHLRRKEVVIVDRDVARADRIRTALEPCGFGVRLCAAPAWTRDVVEERPTDLILVSTSSGIEAIEKVLRYLRARRRTPAAVVLLETTDRGSESEWRLMGFTSALRQPCPVDAIVREVVDILGRPWCKTEDDFLGES